MFKLLICALGLPKFTFRNLWLECSLRIIYEYCIFCDCWFRERWLLFLAHCSFRFVYHFHSLLFYRFWCFVWKIFHLFCVAFILIICHVLSSSILGILNSFLLLHLLLFIVVVRLFLLFLLLLHPTMVIIWWFICI